MTSALSSPHSVVCRRAFACNDCSTPLENNRRNESAARHLARAQTSGPSCIWLHPLSPSRLREKRARIHTISASAHIVCFHLWSIIGGIVLAFTSTRDSVAEVVAAVTQAFDDTAGREGAVLISPIPQLSRLKMPLASEALLASRTTVASSVIQRSIELLGTQAAPTVRSARLTKERPSLSREHRSFYPIPSNWCLALPKAVPVLLTPECSASPSASPEHLVMLPLFEFLLKVYR